MRANDDVVSSSVGSDAERVAVGKDISQSNQDVTLNFGGNFDNDDLAARLNFLASDVEDLRIEFAALNEKYTYAMLNDIKLSIALGIVVILLLIVMYWFGTVLLGVHDDVIRLTAQVQRIQSSGQTQEAINR